MKNGILTTAALALGMVTVSGAAHGADIMVDGIGGPMMLNAGSVGGIFSDPGPDFPGSTLGSLHTALHGSGISTDGLVTFMPVHTDAGLAFVALVDDNTAGSGGDIATLGMTTVGPDTAAPYINDFANEDMTMLTGPGTQTVAGTFEWKGNKGDGFAWAGLESGDFMTFNFNETDDSGVALTGLDAFQFVSWNGDGWEIAGTGDFTEDGQYAFSLSVIPLPAPVLLGAVGLAAVIARRRRNGSA